MSYLLDTDVLSEGAKPQPDGAVLRWLLEHEQACYTSSLVAAELERGIARLPAGRRKQRLEKWLAELKAALGARILPFDSSTAETWGQMLAELEQRGQLPPHPDSYILATAKRHGLTLVTRNVSHYAGRGVPVLNPFTGARH